MFCDEVILWDGTFVFLYGEHRQGVDGLVGGEGGTQRTSKDVLEKKEKTPLNKYFHNYINDFI